MAYLARVNLSAQGFYKTPNTWMDWDKGIGQPFAYFSYGVGCSVVEIDTLTGSFQVSKQIVDNYYVIIFCLSL